MSKILKSSNQINLIEFKDGKPTSEISDTFLVMQSILPNTIRPELKIAGNTKIIFWNLFHFNLVPDFLPINGLRKLHHKSNIIKKIDSIFKKKYYSYLSNFVGDLHDNSSIYFMDQSNYDITNQYLDIKISKPNILPICVDDTYKQKKINLNKNTSHLNICWVGRIEDFKTTILKHSIIKLYDFANEENRKIHFSIIGYGKDIKKIKNSILESEFFNYSFMGAIQSGDLNQFLINNVDILMSMGTAALDGGKLGVPTVLLDASYETIPADYKFKWLFESDGSNVASFIEGFGYKNKGHSINKIISSFDKNATNLGLKCKEYVEQNHSIKVIAELLINKLGKATFVWGNINPELLKKNIIRKLYNNYRHSI